MGDPDCPNIDKTDTMTSSVQPVITVQLREPLTIHTYLPRVLSYPTLSVNSIPVADELDGATFHTLEIMQAIRVSEEVEVGYTKLSRAMKMVASEILNVREAPTDSYKNLPWEETVTAGVDDIIEGICNLFVAMAGEEQGKNLNKLTIRDAERREIL
ncbi:hypothetical protein H5410_030531 [Solanum commersonii]|uniref:Uncharacterized protein n=1 Tax=Solanum commersonii TaxID=4109 RepID=A0A9J5YFY6_SOLCO|nr:hypothetical protein H5410_030531 [Solanum commersonii]